MICRANIFLNKSIKQYCLIFFIGLFQYNLSVAQKKQFIYSNPIIHADYSDPDAIRVGSDYYMTASSFNSVPGLPILHSKDLVHWQIINYALPELYPVEHFNRVQPGGGVWAPSIRYRNGEFYIYYPDPDFGIYLIKAKDIKGKWSEPVLVDGGKGLIDPCPLWDDDGRCYLVHAFAGSRAGVKSILVVKEMDKTGTKIIGNSIMIYDGHKDDPTVEGPKFYKRNGYYYVFAPAGGVGTGWQIVLRSKSIYGPYERKIVMQQGKSNINGPHQGAWINDEQGNDWFLHFQDKDAYGRIVHLQPMHWKNDFPIIGSDEDGDGVGEPVVKYQVNTGRLNNMIYKPAFDFNQFQWQANPKPTWGFKTPDGSFRMFSVYDSGENNLWLTPNIFTQKFPAESFTATAKITFNPSPKSLNEKFGMVVFGTDYAYLSIEKKDKQYEIGFAECTDADKNNQERELIKDTTSRNEIYCKVKVEKGAVCSFYYSINDKDYVELYNHFIAKPGKWVGAKLGFFFKRKTITNDAGSTNIDWLRIE